eukprot:Blabericola_migrator_1__9308@NODE_4_length_29828_cov_96_571587_g3_i0_p13_GENE_NODE_4_length_29828_cov_96_571587_g3_i0NODE_4_length_29828_cov_96_571587_g3_i0_p13_ORF_typecomplete_len179_score22_53_NODE_4_length_29828_cov_96_571587_g3_i01239712933
MARLGAAGAVVVARMIFDVACCTGVKTSSLAAVAACTGSLEATMWSRLIGAVDDEETTGVSCRSGTNADSLLADSTVAAPSKGDARGADAALCSGDFTGIVVGGPFDVGVVADFSLADCAIAAPSTGDSLSEATGGSSTSGAALDRSTDDCVVGPSPVGCTTVVLDIGDARSADATVC